MADEKFIPRIREKRMEAHLSQTELAKLVGIRSSHLSELESGTHEPKPRLLWKIAKHCNCLVDDLYKLEE